jgi:hypothetical protein
MAAKKSSPAGKSRRTTRKKQAPRSTRRTPAGAGAGTYSALRGRAPRATVMSVDLSRGPVMAAGELAEKREPRPYTTRYPIPDEQFADLKSSAATTRLARDADVARSADTGTKSELSAMAARMPSEEAAEPSAAPSPSANFAGIAATGWLPPDCTMAAGPSHVLLSVNSSLAIHNKTGGSLVVQRTLTQWFGTLADGLTVFDPKVLFDQHAGRWVVLAVAFRTNPNRSVFLLSVSASANPLGSWRNYTFDAMRDGATATSNWADFPGLGVDTHALYVTANMFAFNGGFQYSKIRVIPKAGPYAGGAAPFFDFVRMRNPDNSMAFTIQPCHTFGAPQVEYLVNSRFPSGNALTLWRITGAAGTPALARANVPTGAYSLPPNADQKGGAPPLNTGDVRVLHAVFRGGSVWLALTTNRNWGLGNRASVHWFQIQPANNSLVQEGVYGTRAAHYFYPAGCADNNGNFILVFSRSGTNEFGSIGYTGRRASDPLGQLQASALLKAGVATYQGLDSHGRNRWGDYNGVAADPANPRVVWIYSEFASALNTWGTWVGSTFF